MQYLMHFMKHSILRDLVNTKSILISNCIKVKISHQKKYVLDVQLIKEIGFEIT